MAAQTLPARSKDSNTKPMIHYLSNLQEQIANGQIEAIRDSRNNIIVAFQSASTPYNYLLLQNANSTEYPLISVEGQDTNIGLSFFVKGDGVFEFGSEGLYGAAFRLFDATTKSIELRMPDNLLADRQVAFPDASGTILLTDSSGSVNIDSIKDRYGNLIVSFTGSPNAVNWVNIKTTSADPVISAVGANSNIHLRLEPKGQGSAIIRSTDGNSPLILMNKTGAGYDLHDVSSLTAPRAITWPDDSGIVILSTGVANLLYTYSPGGTQRSVQSRLRDYASVKDFGAVGNGTADDTTAFQAAVNNVRNIYIPPGTYKITSTITISNNNQNIWGAGKAAVTLLSSATGPTISCAAGILELGLRDFRLLRSGIPASGDHGIVFQGISNLVALENLEVLGFYIGYLLGGTGYSYVRNCLADSNYSHGFYITHQNGTAFAFQWTFDRVLSELNNGWGYKWEATAGSATSMGELRNIDSFGNGLGGLYFLGSASHTLEALRIMGGFVGQDGDDEILIDAHSGSTHRISNVYVELAGTSPTGIGQAIPTSNSGSGIVVLSGNYDIQISNTIVDGNAEYGISSAATKTSISNCEISRSGAVSSVPNMDGLYISAGSAYLSNCISRDNTGYGYNFVGDTHIVMGCSASGNTSGGINGSVALDDSQIIGNIGFTSVSNVVLGNMSLSGLTATTFLYANSGKTITSLSSVNNAVASTDGSGTPQLSTTLPTNIAVTTPKVTTGIKDVNGNLIIGFTPTASAVNYLDIKNNSTGNQVVIQSKGTDTNINLDIFAKGTGKVVTASLNSNVALVMSNSALTFALSHDVGSLSADRTVTWPDASGTVLYSTGSTSITTVGTVTSGTWNATKIGLAYGGTNADLSATGGTSQVLKQTSSGANITVGQLAASDLSNGTTGSGNVVLKTSPAITTPSVTASVNDANSNTIIGLSPTASAANYVSLANNTAGNSPSIQSAGASTNINLNIFAKGTGKVVMASLNSHVPLILYNNGLTASTSHDLSTLTTDRTVTWPDATGTVVLKDSNSNVAANNFSAEMTQTATAASTTTLTVASDRYQDFTGSTTQTVTMPVVSTLSLGFRFEIFNHSSGNVTVQSSGANTIATLTNLQGLVITCQSTSGTGTASWTWYVTTLGG